MTTVVADPITGTMAADTKGSDGSVKFRCSKIHRHEDEIIGCAGALDDIQSWLAWYRSGRPGRRPKISQCEALVLSAEGLVSWTNYEKVVMPRAPFAIGSGAKAALGALHMGADAARAVEVACLVDDGSELPIEVQHLDSNLRASDSQPIVPARVIADTTAAQPSQ